MSSGHGALKEIPLYGVKKPPHAPAPLPGARLTTDAVAAATKAADTARERAAEYLLAARLEQLRERSADRTEQIAAASWADRLPGLARTSSGRRHHHRGGDRMSELSGVDLARQALTAAREAAKRSGAITRKPKHRITTVVRRDGREALGLGAANGRMMTERGLVTPAVGGTVLADFDAILTAAVPERAGRVQAFAFDVDTGRLDLVPDAPAVGTKLRSERAKPIHPSPASGCRTRTSAPCTSWRPRR
ncbi:hypothetical protein ABT354_36000 [Streptomyces sp. NPDC000594]|uniref:hypothetical protein n=1 Tax=Streptomyces sp. NPDC000594 TaxID=3154261 RepID=UPI00333272D5